MGWLALGEENLARMRISWTYRQAPEGAYGYRKLSFARCYDKDINLGFAQNVGKNMRAATRPIVGIVLVTRVDSR